MSKSRVLCWGILLLAVAGCSKGRKREDPVYQGKHLSTWVEDLKNPDVQERRRAARTLGEMGKEAYPAFGDVYSGLQEAFRNEDKPTRYWAAISFAKVVEVAPRPPYNPGGVAGPVLEEAAQEGDEEVQAAARAALKKHPDWTSEARARRAGPPPFMRGRGGRGGRGQEAGRTAPKDKGADQKKEPPKDEAADPKQEPARAKEKEGAKNGKKRETKGAERKDK